MFGLCTGAFAEYACAGADRLVAKPAKLTFEQAAAVEAPNTGAPTLKQADAARLQQYDWPGNIRELQNVIERPVILSKGDRLRLDFALAGLPTTATSALDMPEVILTDRECRAR